MENSKKSRVNILRDIELPTVPKDEKLPMPFKAATKYNQPASRALDRTCTVDTCLVRNKPAFPYVRGDKSVFLNAGSNLFYGNIPILGWHGYGKNAVCRHGNDTKTLSSHKEVQEDFRHKKDKRYSVLKDRHWKPDHISFYDSETDPRAGLILLAKAMTCPGMYYPGE